MIQRLACLFIAILFASVAAGCLSAVTGDTNPPAPPLSEAPLPKLFPMTAQEKIQAVHHWDLIAKHTAGLVKSGLQTGYPQRVGAIYVAPSGTTPFEKAFHSLLITRLFEEGLSVVNDPRDNLTLSFDVDLVKHPTRIIGIDSDSFDSLGPGLVVQTGPSSSEARKDAQMAYVVGKRTRLDSDTGDYRYSLPQNEIVLTTSLTQNGGFIMRHSAIYYIDDPEWWQYVQEGDITYPSRTHYLLTDR
jgi:hypothetical protein